MERESAKCEPWRLDGPVLINLGRKEVEIVVYSPRGVGERGEKRKMEEKASNRISKTVKAGQGALKVVKTNVRAGGAMNCRCQKT